MILNFGLGVGNVLLLLFLAALLISAIRILREYERGVVFQLGRFWKVKGPGAAEQASCTLSAGAQTQPPPPV